MINKICILTEFYPCEATPIHHVFVQKIAWAMRDAGVKVAVISPVPVHKRIHKSTPEACMEITANGNEVSVYRPRYMRPGLRSVRGSIIGTTRITEYLFRKACIGAIDKMQVKPDVYYGHFIVISGISACGLGLRYLKPAFVAFGESHNNLFGRYGLKNIKKALSDVSGIIAVSSKNKNGLLESGIVPVEKIGLFINGINTELFYPRPKEEARASFGLGDEDFVVAFVGRFIKQKGVHIVDKAVRELGNVKALFAGEGEYTPAGEHVCCAKPVKQDEIPWLLSAADVFVFPSQNEGCSNALLEAMACGIPIIASDLDFNYDILDETNAILVNGLDVEEIKSAIKALMDDPSMRHSMSEASKLKVKQLGIEQRAENIIKWIDEKIL